MRLNCTMGSWTSLYYRWSWTFCHDVSVSRHHDVIALNLIRPSIYGAPGHRDSQLPCPSPQQALPAPLGGSKVIRWDTSTVQFFQLILGLTKRLLPFQNTPRKPPKWGPQEAFSSDVRTTSAGSLWCEGAAALLRAHLNSIAPLLSILLFFWSLPKLKTTAECWKPDQPVWGSWLRKYRWKHYRIRA